MEERVIPPDEKEWTEEKDRMKEYTSKTGIFFSRVRHYVSEKMSGGLTTIEVLDFGIILKCQAIHSPEKKKFSNFFYLILSDGRWVRGLEDVFYDVDVVIENREEGSFLKITYTLRTPSGICRRILRKKIED